MTIKELADFLNTTVTEMISYYKYSRFIDIPDDADYILSDELIRKAIPNYLKKDIENENKLPESGSSSDIPNTINYKSISNIIDNNADRKISIIEEQLQFYNKSDRFLIKHFKSHNVIDSLFFEGRYRKINNQNFGYFEDIITSDGKEVTYPITNDRVNDVYIRTGELTNGKYYAFEATLANKYERERHNNPFLPQSKPNTVKEIELLSALETEIEIKSERLKDIEEHLMNSQRVYDEKVAEIEVKVNLLLEEKKKEADLTIERYNEKIINTFQELQNKNEELDYLKETIHQSKNKLTLMEKLVSTIKERISLCRNLQFISELEEKRYLDFLSVNHFLPKEHLDFGDYIDCSFSKLADHIHAYLFRKKNLIYTRYQIRNFLTLIKTHDIVILSGLSGSGKTQIVKAFAEAIGGIAKIIPVKPNWTSSEDLIGYYNPIQMSFLPTPFTEAIVEAIHNPNQLYLICLDEMNLARAEYYFADFLSKLEERNGPPEIELYAQHEEELFISEFNTLLNLIESSINGESITSWQKFLDSETIRKSFFEKIGSTDKESMLQLHAKMKRRLVDILKFPANIKIPQNIRFIGAINVDETTHYFSPKILDRIHVIKFENPLLFEEEVNKIFDSSASESELLPIYVHPKLFSERREYPHLNVPELSEFKRKLKEINERFLLPLNIDFGIRSIRQSLNYYVELQEIIKLYYYKIEGADLPVAREDVIMGMEPIKEGISYKIPLNSILIQKIFPRFIFDGNEIAKNGKTKLEIAEEFLKYLSEEFSSFYTENTSDKFNIGKTSSEFLTELIEHAKKSANSQVNFFV